MKTTDAFVLAREMERREMERRQAEQRQLVALQSAQQQRDEEQKRIAELARFAEVLRNVNQQNREAQVAADARRKEEQQTRAKGSPIETAFLEAWRQVYPAIELHCQYHVLTYRLDFAHLPSKTAIELDGQAFHSRRKDRNKDYARQHAIEDAGWHFVRFTGSQVWTNSDMCVARVYKVIAERMAW